MTRAEKIEAIYEKIANKELTFWCRVNTEYWRIVSIVEETADEKWYIVVSEESLYNDEDIGAYYCWLRVRWLEDMESIDVAKIIWHPVMIGDVLDWIEKKEFDIHKPIPWFWFEEEEKISDESKLYLIQDYYIDNLISYWDKKRETIESQSDECIDYIYSLISK